MSRIDTTPRLIIYSAAIKYMSKKKMTEFNVNLLDSNPKTSTAFKEFYLANFDIERFIKKPKHPADPLLYNYLAYEVKKGPLKKHRDLTEYIKRTKLDQDIKSFNSIPTDVALLLF